MAARFRHRGCPLAARRWARWCALSGQFEGVTVIDQGNAPAQKLPIGGAGGEIDGIGVGPTPSYPSLAVHAPADRRTEPVPMLVEKETYSGMLTVPVLLVRRKPPRDRHLCGCAPAWGGTWATESTYRYVPARSIENVATMGPVMDASVPAWTVIGHAGPGPGACLGMLGSKYIQPALHRVPSPSGQRSEDTSLPRLRGGTARSSRFSKALLVQTARPYPSRASHGASSGNPFCWLVPADRCTSHPNGITHPGKSRRTITGQPGRDDRQRPKPEVCISRGFRVAHVKKRT